METSGLVCVRAIPPFSAGKPARALLGSLPMLHFRNNQTVIKKYIWQVHDPAEERLGYEYK